jgi:excisionase family DNA binding protein
MNTLLMKLDDVAIALGVSRSYAYQLARSGQLTSVKLGRSVRVRPEDLERFIKENLTSVPPNVTQ